MSCKGGCGDRYDEMNDPIAVANRLAREIETALKAASVPVKEVIDADYDVDASVEINDTYNIQVSVYGGFILNWWTDESTMMSKPSVNTIPKIVKLAQEAISG